MDGAIGGNLRHPEAARSTHAIIPEPAYLSEQLQQMFTCWRNVWLVEVRVPLPGIVVSLEQSLTEGGSGFPDYLGTTGHIKSGCYPDTLREKFRQLLIKLPRSPAARFTCS